MKTLTSTEFTRTVGKVIDTVRTDKVPYCVRAHGRSGVVIIGEERYDELVAAERQLTGKEEDDDSDDESDSTGD